MVKCAVGRMLLEIFFGTFYGKLFNQLLTFLCEDLSSIFITFSAFSFNVIEKYTSLRFLVTSMKIKDTMIFVLVLEIIAIGYLRCCF